MQISLSFSKIRQEDQTLDPYNNYRLSGGYVRAEDAEYYDADLDSLLVVERDGSRRWFNVHKLDDHRPGYGIRWEIRDEADIASEEEDMRLFG